MEFLDREIRSLNFSRHDRFEIGFFAQWPKAEHVEQWLAILLTARRPVVECLDIGEAGVGGFFCLGAGIIGQVWINAIGFGIGTGAVNRVGQKKRNEREKKFRLHGAGHVAKIYPVWQRVSGPGSGLI